MGGSAGQHTDSRDMPGSARFLHGTVAESLRSWVTEGRLTAGSKLPALREIAAKFDVSTMTVRRAIRTLEHEGYVQRIPAVGIFVSKPEQHRAKTVTFVVTDLFSPFEVALARGVQKTCHGRGWQVQLFEARADGEDASGNPLIHATSESRGAIVLPTCTAQNVELLRELRRARFPFVVVDRPVPGLHADIVESDHERAGYLATAHLLRKGHKRVLMVTVPPRVESERARMRGYTRALEDAGIQPSPDWRSFVDPEIGADDDRRDRRWRGAYEAMLPFLKELTPPVGVFAHNACSGWGVYEACRELGLRIPQDVSVVCIDDSDIARAMTPPITAIAQRTDVIAETAVELLMRRIESAEAEAEGPQMLIHAVIDVDLIERPSVAEVAAG